MQTAVFPSRERSQMLGFFLSFFRNLSKRHGEYSFGLLQSDRKRDLSVPRQGMFLAEVLSSLTWYIGWGSASLDWASPALVESLSPSA